MGTVFLGTLRMLVRERSLFVWALAFPLILSTIFMFMFDKIDEGTVFEPVATAVVADDAWGESDFSAVVDRLSQPGDGQLLAIREFASGEAARVALENGEVAGVLRVDADGRPEVEVAPAVSLEGVAGFGDVNRSILETVATAYMQDSRLIADLAAENPLVFADPSAVEAAFIEEGYTKEVSLTRSAPRETVRFYYALFGMAALFGAQIAVYAICQTQPNLSPVGARRALGGLSRGRTLLVTVAASWLVSFACLAVAFAYVRLVVGVDFGNRDGAALLGMAAAALMACSVGCALGALPKVDMGGKAGLLTGGTCLLSLFAGLYGQPCMQLADEVARNFPLLASLNPAKAICDMFYSLYYYDGLAVFGEKLALLAAMTAVLFAVAMVFMRRQRYASI